MVTDNKVESKVSITETKLAKADINWLQNGSQTGLVFTTEVDNMVLPTEYKKLIKTCRFFYKHDPVAATILNKMVDFAVSPMLNQQGKCTDDEFAVYDSLKEGLEEFYRNVCLEYLLSGLVMPEYEWERMPGSKLSPELNSRTRFNLPNNIWFRDPSSITIKPSPIGNKKYFYVTIDADTIYFIKNNGKKRDGTKDEETYKTMEANYPDFVKKVKESKGTTLEILLPDARPILSRCLPEDPYPIPYMTNALESLMHKRNMRKMDYSIAARVIAAIQLIKLGNDLYPCTDNSDFAYIKNQMNYQTRTGYNEKIFQLYANHTLEITWVSPDTAAMLNHEKYSSVEDDIIAAFGFPRALITGETLRSNVTGGSDLASFSPIATLDAIRAKLIDWTKDLYTEIQEKNDFKNSPIPAFTPIKLYSIVDLNVISRDLYKEGSLSRKTRLELQSLDQDTEIERKKKESELYKSKGIEEAPMLPFSSPSIGNTGATKSPKAPAPTTTKVTPKSVTKPATKPKAKAEEEDNEESGEE
jgi:hypothetical protein